MVGENYCQANLAAAAVGESYTEESFIAANAN